MPDLAPSTWFALFAIVFNLAVLAFVVRFILLREKIVRTEVILSPPPSVDAPATSPATHGVELVLMDDERHGVFETLRSSGRIPHTIRHNGQLFTHRRFNGRRHIYTRGLTS